MTEEQRDAYLRTLETMTFEYQWQHGNRRSERLPRDGGVSSHPVLRAEKGLPGDAHYVHICKHSDLLAGRPTQMHRHEFFEFNFLCRGHCHNQVDGQDLYYGVDTLILMSPEAAHGCWVDSVEDQVVNFLITPDVVEHCFINLMSSDNHIARFFLDYLFGQKQMPTYMLFHIDETVMDIFWDMIREYLQKPPFYEQIILSDMIKLFAELIRRNPAPEETPKSEHAELSEILSYMQQHCADVTLRELSETFNYSYVYISRMLKKETGKTFSDLLTEFRLQRACNYLRNSTISAETISELIGYSDVSYFYKVFKRRYQTNPSEYRKA